MEWNCNNCKREIISEKKETFCLECGWKDLVAKIEINPETIRSFMERHYFTYFMFVKGDYEDFIKIGVHKKILGHYYLLEPDYKLMEEEYHCPQSKRNIIKRRGNGWKGKEYNEYSAFLEKLFHFAEKEKIKRIRVNYNIEKKILEEVKLIQTKKILFKVSDIIIEKKTAQELEKEKNIL